MADILPFRRRSHSVKTGEERPRGEKSPGEAPGGNTLCRNGHHKWKVDNSRQFDVKAGKLVTAYRCSRCGKARVRAH